MSVSAIPHAGTTDQATVEGTVVWIGSTEHPEFVDAFRYLQATASQLAIRANQTEWLMRPASQVNLIVFARVRRYPLLPSVAPEISRRYPAAEVLVLNGSLCDGERRTGQAWKAFSNLRFDRWQQRIMPQKNALSLEGVKQPLTLLLFDRYRDAEPLLQMARAMQVPAIWSRQYNPATLAGVQRILWDETVAPKQPRWDWAQPLACRSNAFSCQHHWLVTQPQADDIAYAMRSGVHAVHSKPLWDIEFLGGSPQPS